jgi:hypothetical protein
MTASAPPQIHTSFNAVLVKENSEEFGASPQLSQELQTVKQLWRERLHHKQQSSKNTKKSCIDFVPHIHTCPIVDAKIIEGGSFHKWMLLREEWIRQLKEELTKSMNSPGAELLEKADSRSRRSRGGVIGKFIGRLKVPFGREANLNEEGLDDKMKIAVVNGLEGYRKV